MSLPHWEVDVFTDRPYRGNPLAVELGADGIDTETMQRFANWTNFSETTFVLAPTQPDADYRVRIFTPTPELPFSGSPTVRWGPVEPELLTRIASVLGIERSEFLDSTWVDNGPGWVAGRAWIDSEIGPDGEAIVWVGGGVATCVRGEVEFP